MMDDVREKVIKVEAEDQQLRLDLLGKLKLQERDLGKRMANREILVQAHKFDNRSTCAECCTSFSFFHKATKCKTCSYNICKGCIVTSAATCTLCDASRDLQLSMKEWSMMFPYGSESYGVRKYAAHTPPHITSETLWNTRACIEMTATEILNSPLDEVNVDTMIRDEQLNQLGSKVSVCVEHMILTPLNENLQRQTKLTEFKSHLDAMRSVFLEYRSIGLMVKSEKTPIPKMYTEVLSRAVLNRMAQDYSSWPIETSSVSTATQTNMRDCLCSHNFTLDTDSAFDTDVESTFSTNSGMNNWFLKDPNSFSPGSSVRSHHSFTRTALAMPAIKDSPYINNSGDDLSEVEEDVTKSRDIAPHFITHPTSLVAESGQMVKLECEVTGTEPIDIHWYNSCGEIEDGGRYLIYQRSPKCSLYIFDAKTKDTDEIVCLAVNDISVTTAIANVHVSEVDMAGEEPQFAECLNPVVVKEKEKLTLKCRVIGYPKPRVTFHRNNSRIKEQNRMKIDMKGDEWILSLSGALVIDSGQYAAVATNRFGRAVSRTAVSVLLN